MPYKDRATKYRYDAVHRARNREALAVYLASHPCVDCGEADPVVLEFDHVRGQKRFEIGKAVSGSCRSWATIFTEIEKCEVRCCNCHRKITHRRYRQDFSGYRHLPVSPLASNQVEG